MRGNLKIFLYAVLVAWILAPTASNAGYRSENELYRKAVECRQKLNGSSAFARKEANWLECINKFKLVYIQYPDTRLTDNILLDIGDLYLLLYTKTKNDQYLRWALNSFRELYYYYPRSRFAAEATIKAGDIYFKYLRQYKQAYGAYSRLLAYYGSSDEAREARRRLKRLSIYYSPADSEDGSSRTKVTVNEIRHWTSPRYTRVVIDLNYPVSYKDEVIKSPDRLFIDLYGARISGELIGRPITINDGLLKRVRVAQYNNNTVRVVLDIDKIESYKIFELENPFRIIIDVSSNGKKKKRRAALAARVKSEPNNGKKKLSLARQLGLGIETIVIDPGHGGKDPGAVGASGILEKNIVLDISKKLKRIIEQETGRRVYLTRYTDVFVPLEERTAKANTQGADLFVSVHVNANTVKAARGIETYYLSLATSPEEQETAARENSMSFKKISDLGDILKNMMLNSKKEESSMLARHIQTSLVKGLGGTYRAKNLGVKKAPFYVLIGAEMPSVLVEVSFITNPSEEKLLASGEYRRAVARQIYRGLEAYIAQMKAQTSMASN